MTVVLAMMGIYNGLVSDALNIVKAPQADIWVVEADTQGPFAEASKIPNDTRDAVARLHGVALAGSITYQTIEAPFKGATLRLYAIGYERGRVGGPQSIVAGRGLEAAISNWWPMPSPGWFWAIPSFWGATGSRWSGWCVTR